MTAERIAVAAMKGGVGKSFTSVNLATGLARASWRCLLVDCDAQSNATSMFSNEDTVEFDLFDVIKGHVDVRKTILSTRVDGLDLLPSTLAVALLDHELISMHRREDKVFEAVEPVLNDYSVIVFDLPPALNAVVISALSAATSLVVPTDASRWGRRGAQMFLEWGEDLRRAKVLSADLLGVLLTKYESGTRIGREIRSELRESGLPVFQTYVPKRTAAERMVNNRLVIGDPNADPDLSEAYGQFTLEVIQRVNECRAVRGRHSQ
ncbi:MAG: ParA family protein [Pseudonocardiaceae bacterium]